VQEYQAKQIMAKYNVPHQRGLVISDASDAQQVGSQVQEMYKSGPLIVKAQILAGGRGKGHFDTGYQGGVKFCTSLDKVEEASKEMLGNKLITKQTGDEGTQVNKVMITECLDFDEEFYFAMLMDRELGPVMVVSKEGGMDIEEVAENTPEAILTLPIDVNKGITDADINKIIDTLELTGEPKKQCAEVVNNIYSMFRGADVTTLEINPLVVTDSGDLVCVDGKVGIDDNAEFRQQDIFSQADNSEMDPREIEAAKYDLSYVGLSGNIGCLVNGAGLAMATMDIIKLYGGSPSNFLDVGGSATTEQIENAFRIITQDKKVKCILVNIFGGIMRCDVISEGIVKAVSNLGLEVPLVVRLSGTNHEEGKKILAASGIKVQSANDLNEAAELAVSALPKEERDQL